MKHNKKRNTAFIYESLILEMTKSVLNRDIKRKNKIIGIIKEFFNSESILKYELEAYKSIYETKGVPPKTAERILMEAQRVYFGLNPQYVFRDQTKLIKKVNKDLGKDVFNNFLPNYKTLASISQIFNFKTTPKKKIILENNVLDEMLISDTESCASDLTRVSSIKTTKSVFFWLIVNNGDCVIKRISQSDNCNCVIRQDF